MLFTKNVHTNFYGNKKQKLLGNQVKNSFATRCKTQIWGSSQFRDLKKYLKAVYCAVSEEYMPTSKGTINKSPWQLVVEHPGNQIQKSQISGSDWDRAFMFRSWIWKVFESSLLRYFKRMSMPVSMATIYSTFQQPGEKTPWEPDAKAGSSQVKRLDLWFIYERYLKVVCCSLS